MKRFPLLATILAFAASVPVFGQTVDTVIPLGGSTVAAVPENAPSTVGVLISAGTAKITISIKLAKGSGLDPVLSVVRPDGVPLDAGALAAAGATVKIKPKGVTVKNMPAPVTGLYKLVLRGKGGTSGGYTMKTKGKAAKVPTINGNISGVGEKDDHTIAAPDNAFLTATLKIDRRSALGPRLELLGASGIPLDTGPFLTEKGGKISLKNLPLPFFGEYRLRVSSVVGAGAYTMKVKVKAKKRRPDASRPVAGAGDGQVAAPGALVMLEGTAPAGATYSWEQVSGAPVTLSDHASATPTFLAPPEKGTRVFQLVANRGGVLSVPATVVVEIDQAPIAVGGPSLRVDPGAAVEFDGSKSFDLDPGDALSFSWKQVSGTPVELSGADTASPSFTAPATAGPLLFELTANDGLTDSVPDRVVVAVGAGMPVADAGRPVVVPLQDSVFLSGARSIGAASPPETWAWSRVDGDGTPIALSGTDGPVASFTSPRTVGSFRFCLVADGNAATADEVLVLVTRGVSNRGPRADAGGSQDVAQGSPFTVSGAGSTDPQGPISAHEWTQLSGTWSGLAGTGASRDGGAPFSDEVLRFLLMVHDGLRYGPPDRTAVVSGALPDPLADAGPDRSGIPGAVLSLSSAGSRAPAGRAIAAWQWTQTSGRGFYDVAARDGGFDPSSASPQIRVSIDLSSLSPDRAFTFDLVVTDDAGAKSAADSVVVTFLDLPENAPPRVTAGASATDVRPGLDVMLLGAAADGDGDPLATIWRQISGAPVTIRDATKLDASFTAPGVPGSLVFELEADDGAGTATSKGMDRVTVTVNEPPNVVATANPPSGPEGTFVTLDASLTTDPTAEPLTYEWTELSPPGGVPVVLIGASTAKATFAVPAYTGSVAARTRTFRVTVTDSVGSVPREVTFVPNAAPTFTSAPTTDQKKIRYDNTDAATLSAAAATDPDGDPVTIEWSITAGPGTSSSLLSATTGSSVLFKVPKPTPSSPSTGGVYTISAVASDGALASAPSTVKVLAYPSWSKDVYSIISSTCATSSCHGNSSSPTGGLFMGTSAATALGNLVNKASNGSSSLRVKPNDHKSSFLWQKVNSGSMPKGGSKLSVDKINMIRDWIEPDGSGGSSGISSGAESN